MGCIFHPRSHLPKIAYLLKLKIAPLTPESLSFSSIPPCFAGKNQKSGECSEKRFKVSSKILFTP
jgi:hypothetical protein